MAKTKAAIATLTPAFDVVVKSGRVIDPKNGLDAIRDIGIRRGRIAAVERQAAGEQFEQHHAERINVGLAGKRLPEHLLGRHIEGRAHCEHGPRRRCAVSSVARRCAYATGLSLRLCFSPAFSIAVRTVKSVRSFIVNLS